MTAESLPDRGGVARAQSQPGTASETLFRVLCRLGFHRWPRLGTSTWVVAPEPLRNALGLAMEYRACERCGRLRDVTTWPDAGDPDLGVPRGVGPLAAARIDEIMAAPYKPLPAEPLPIREMAE